MDNIIERPVSFGLNELPNLFTLNVDEIIGVHPESVLHTTFDGFREKAIRVVIGTFLPD